MNPVYRLHVARKGKQDINIPGDADGFVIDLTSIDYNSRSNTFGDLLHSCTIRVRYDGYERVLEIYDNAGMKGKPIYRLGLYH